MQRLNTVWQMVNAASTVKEMAQHKKTYYFAVNSGISFYLQAEHADVRLVRWARPQIEATVRLQVPFGWRVAAEQDDAGVYIAAARRAVVGGLSSARFDVLLPEDVYVTLKLANCTLQLDGVNGLCEITPPGSDRQITVGFHSA